jgi:hypothetical protein
VTIEVTRNNMTEGYSVMDPDDEHASAALKDNVYEAQFSLALTLPALSRGYVAYIKVHALSRS